VKEKATELGQQPPTGLATLQPAASISAVHAAHSLGATPMDLMEDGELQRCASSAEQAAVAAAAPRSDGLVAAPPSVAVGKCPMRGPDAPRRLEVASRKDAPGGESSDSASSALSAAAENVRQPNEGRRQGPPQHVPALAALS